MLFKDIQFKDVKMFENFYQFGHKYTKIRRDMAENVVTLDRAMCDPDNWVLVEWKEK